MGARGFEVYQLKYDARRAHATFVIWKQGNARAFDPGIDEFHEAKHSQERLFARRERECKSSVVQGNGDYDPSHNISNFEIPFGA
jgi:hypothetical protein